MPAALPLLERDPIGQLSRRLVAHRSGRLGALLRELRDAEDATPQRPTAVPPALRVAGVPREQGSRRRRRRLSPSHLSRIFKAQTGISITRFRNQRRLERFMALYGSGARTTALAAALEAGFGSYAQFYRVLRVETGRTPTALRRHER